MMRQTAYAPKKVGIDKQHLNTDIVDDATIEIDADDGLRVKEGGLNDLHVSGSLNNEQKVAYRQKLEADKVSSGDGITINEHDNAQRIAVTNPFTDEDETLLQEVASNSSGHLSGDELVLRSQYGSEHFFGDSRRAIVSIAHDGSDIFLADPTGRVNRKPTLVGDTAVYGLATNGMNWYVGSNHQHRIHVLHLNSSENFVSASPASTITVESKDLAIDVEDGTTLYQMRYDAGLQLRAYTISETEGNGQCDIQVTRTITTASINSLLNSHDVLSLGAIINTNQNVGVTAFSARDSYLYFAVSGVYRENRQSQTTAIIRASITGTGTNRDFTLDTDYIQLVNVLNGVNGLYPTEDGFWMARSYSALDFRLGEFNSTELDDMPDAPEAEDDGKALVYNHDDANYQLKHLRLPASFFWFQDQTVRLPIETIDNSHPDLAGNDVAILNGDDADEDFNGGIGTATTGNLDDESNADVRPDTDRTFIEIHTGGVFHIKVKVLAIASAQPAPTVVIRKIENNTDDALLLHNAGYAAGSAVANIATTFSEKEEYVSLSANDKIYIRFHNLNQARRAVGYIQIERVT